LITALHVALFQEATDARGKIYALHEFSNRLEMDFPAPDYKQDVYIKAAASSIRFFTSLGILSPKFSDNAWKAYPGKFQTRRIKPLTMS
jgi:hypothetical protein